MRRRLSAAKPRRSKRQSSKDDLLEDGTLVKPLDLSIRTGRGYYVIKRADVAMSPETKVLFDWVVRMGQSEAQVP